MIPIPLVSPSDESYATVGLTAPVHASVCQLKRCLNVFLFPCRGTIAMSGLAPLPSQPQQPSFWDTMPLQENGPFS